MSEPLPLMHGMDTVISELELFGQQKRWSVTRLGQREPIPAIVRALVLKRDGGQCAGCSGAGWRRDGSLYRSSKLQLDHIVPWSAGGTDHSSNLRLLCEGCNEDRSNFIGGLDFARRVGVVPACVPCLAAKYGDPDAAGQVAESDHEPAYCGTCHMTSWTHKGQSL